MATGYLFKGYINYKKEDQIDVIKTTHFHSKTLEQLNQLRAHLSGPKHIYVGEKVTKYRA